MKKFLAITAILALAACQPTAQNRSGQIDEVAFRQDFNNCTKKGLTPGSDAHKKCTIDAYLADHS